MNNHSWYLTKFSISQNIFFEKGKAHFHLSDYKWKRKYYEIVNDMNVDANSIKKKKMK